MERLGGSVVSMIGHSPSHGLCRDCPLSRPAKERDPKIPPIAETIMCRTGSSQQMSASGLIIPPAFRSACRTFRSRIRNHSHSRNHNHTRNRRRYGGMSGS